MPGLVGASTFLSLTAAKLFREELKVFSASISTLFVSSKALLESVTSLTQPGVSTIDTCGVAAPVSVTEAVFSTVDPTPCVEPAV
ncbi:hypothetical protein D3C71_1807660 [compost metagenome]